MLFLDFILSELSCFLATKQMFYFLFCGDILLGISLVEHMCTTISIHI